LASGEKNSRKNFEIFSAKKDI
ncbi:hypothetical protein LCGC14_2647260, partial [marine sediment metagenome]